MTARTGQRQRLYVVTALIVAISGLLAMAWPYYSLYDLIFGSANETYRLGLGAADRDMYARVLPRIWPALIAVPFIILRLTRGWREPLLLMLGGLLTLYAYGWRTENWAYGRLLSAIMVVVAIILADETARAAEQAASVRPEAPLAARWIQLATLAVVVLGMFQVRHGFVMLPDAIRRHLPYSAVHDFLDMVPTSKFAFLPKFLKEGEVVIADSGATSVVPAFGGRVVAFGAPEAFVDTTQRSADNNAFFSQETSDSVRRQIIERYGATYLLISQYNLTNQPRIYEPLLDLGTIRYSNDRFTLVDLRRP